MYMRLWLNGMMQWWKNGVWLVEKNLLICCWVLKLLYEEILYKIFVDCVNYDQLCCWKKANMKWKEIFFQSMKIHNPYTPSSPIYGGNKILSNWTDLYWNFLVYIYTDIV